MTRKRKQHSAEFKAKVALEALKDQSTLAELAQKYNLHPNQITTWKKEFIANAALVFKKGKSGVKDDEEKAKLFAAIGQLKFENDWLALGFSLSKKRAMVENNNPEVSIKKQCEMLSIQRSGLYYKPCGESALNLELMRQIDEEYLLRPFLGVPRMTEFLRRKGFYVNPKRIRRLYRKMGLQAIYPKPRTTKPDEGHKIYPYLLTGVPITRPNQVWACDITYIPMRKGFMYLVAIIDLYSRYVVGWSISNSLNVDFCIELLKDTIKIHGAPEIFNTDQGSQFTCNEFTSVLHGNDVKISMDGKGRAIDNVFIERLWRSVKQECIYLHAAEDGLDLYKQLSEYFKYYNQSRPH